MKKDEIVKDEPVVDPVLDGETVENQKTESVIEESANRVESDPIGIDAEGRVTTNEGGDPPGSPLEVFERESDPDQIDQARKDSKLPS